MQYTSLLGPLDALVDFLHLPSDWVLVTQSYFGVFDIAAVAASRPLRADVMGSRCGAPQLDLCTDWIPSDLVVCTAGPIELQREDILGLCGWIGVWESQSEPGARRCRLSMPCPTEYY